MCALAWGKGGGGRGGEAAGGGRDNHTGYGSAEGYICICLNEIGL